MLYAFLLYSGHYTEAFTLMQISLNENGKSRTPSNFPLAKLSISTVCVLWTYNVSENVVGSKWHEIFNSPISSAYFVHSVMLNAMNLHVHGVRENGANLYIETQRLCFQQLPVNGC